MNSSLMIVVNDQLKRSPNEKVMFCFNCKNSKNIGYIERCAVVFYMQRVKKCILT